MQNFIQNNLKFVIILGGIIGFIFFGFVFYTSWNNSIIRLDETKKTARETVMLNYSQCLISISETNDVANRYSSEVRKLAEQAGSNLATFDKNLATFLGNNNIIPPLDSELYKNVQNRIISCRDGFSNKATVELKPLYTEYNTEIRAFPGSLFNIFGGYKTDDLVLPNLARVRDSFDSGIDTPLNLNNND